MSVCHSTESIMEELPASSAFSLLTHGEQGEAIPEFSSLRRRGLDLLYFLLSFLREYTMVAENKCQGEASKEDTVGREHRGRI